MNILIHVPALRDSLLTLESKQILDQSVNHSSLEALGMSLSAVVKVSVCRVGVQRRIFLQNVRQGRKD